MVPLQLFGIISSLTGLVGAGAPRRTFVGFDVARYGVSPAAYAAYTATVCSAADEFSPLNFNRERPDMTEPAVTRLLLTDLHALGCRLQHPSYFQNVSVADAIGWLCATRTDPDDKDSREQALETAFVMSHYRDVPLGWAYFAAGVEPSETTSIDMPRAFVVAALRGIFLPPIPCADGGTLLAEGG
ncbi:MULTISPECIES: hypothetical protein [unclassified Knoellia]|uniref:hypothetical protein n=1 Tax=Knoellia altitudinis TaxID=3404795 RepID=UPI00360A3E87